MQERIEKFIEQISLFDNLFNPSNSINKFLKAYFVPIIEIHSIISLLELSILNFLQSASRLICEPGNFSLAISNAA